MAEYLSAVDYVVFGLILVGAIIGAFQGFIEIFSKYAGYIAGLILAIMFTKILAVTVAEKTGLNLFFSTFFSYVAIYLITYILIKSVGNAFSQVADASNFQVVDQILGFVLGLATAVFLIALLSELLSKQSIFDVSNVIGSSWVDNKILQPVKGFIFKFAKELI